LRGLPSTGLAPCMVSSNWANIEVWSVSAFSLKPQVASKASPSADALRTNDEEDDMSSIKESATALVHESPWSACISCDPTDRGKLRMHRTMAAVTFEAAMFS